ncbi:hypothetical protein EJ08DRAFT_385069 [Tothia fuscella]|uniref:F-box domain-containing protein n=1 Tax=Tothia fuscella TaxID=1048955 RepID=A0A9P4NLF1_9PEZI|nr:hypothetical protein EJ08DRAFT_385069 [Tothia fuscella]
MTITQQLPNETLLQICTYLSVPDLKALRLTNHRLQACAVGPLFHSFHLEMRPESFERLGYIVDSHHRRNIKKLTFDPSSIDVTHATDFETWLSDMPTLFAWQYWGLYRDENKTKLSWDTYFALREHDHGFLVECHEKALRLARWQATPLTQADAPINRLHRFLRCLHGLESFEIVGDLWFRIARGDVFGNDRTLQQRKLGLTVKHVRQAVPLFREFFSTPYWLLGLDLWDKTIFEAISQTTLNSIQRRSAPESCTLRTLKLMWLNLSLWVPPITTNPSTYSMITNLQSLYLSYPGGTFGPGDPHDRTHLLQLGQLLISCAQLVSLQF